MYHLKFCSILFGGNRLIKERHVATYVMDFKVFFGLQFYLMDKKQNEIESVRWSSKIPCPWSIQCRRLRKSSLPLDHLII